MPTVPEARPIKVAVLVAAAVAAATVVSTAAQDLLSCQSAASTGSSLVDWFRPENVGQKGSHALPCYAR